MTGEVKEGDDKTVSGASAETCHVYASAILTWSRFDRVEGLLAFSSGGGKMCV